VIGAPNIEGSDADVWVRELKSSEYGDADLNGRVDFDDLLVIAQHYGDATAGWANGNFDGQPGVAFSDLLLIAQSYGFGAPEESMRFIDDWSLARSLVPEPTWLTVSFSVFLGRRRRLFMSMCPTARQKPRITVTVSRPETRDSRTR
jgi:hypothetical protein